MGIQDLQSFLEGSQIEGSCVGVDLFRIARTIAQKWAKQVYKKGHNNTGKFSLVVDAECCLDRLYGGFFSDWVCGGQWNRVTTFLGQFVSSLNVANIEIVVFFNGCTEQTRTQEWIQTQIKNRNKISQVLRHLANKGTPPPKVWWTPPCCLKPTLRMVLRNLNVPVVVTMDDHKQEVIAYCRENNCHAIVADDAEYITFDPPRYFSARHLKLTYKGTLESKEYIVSELTKGLGLTTEQMCVVAALLGNFLLPESDVADLHRRLLSMSHSKKEGEGGGGEPGWEVVRGVARLVQGMETRDPEKLGAEIFPGDAARAARLRQAVQYYLDGTKHGFLKYRSQTGAKKGKRSNSGASHKTEEAKQNQEPGIDTTRLASESVPSELAGLISASEATACLTVGPEIIVEKDSSLQPQVMTQQPQLNGRDMNGAHSLIISSGSSSSSTSPARVGDTTTKNKPQKTVRLVLEDEKLTLPPVAAEIMRTVSERHSKGLMSPLIYQILTQGEIKLPVVMEDELHKDIPSIQLFYRPMRAMVYAILFNLHHLTYMAKNSKDNKNSEVKLPEIKIKEWMWSKANPYQKPEIVKAEPLGWGVPTIQRLWFGTTVDDKRRRLRAYLTCMRSDTQLMLNPSYVPQHLLVLATVLRYIMSFPDKRVLRKHELDALIATAMDPHLPNSEYNQELQVECVGSRGVEVGAMVMAGVEYALLVNDACGAPIPWLVTCPWLYFDGKLLAGHLARALTSKNLLDLCSHRIPQVVKVERMREAVLEGLFVQWARPPLLPPLNPVEAARVHSVLPAGMPRNSGRGGAVLPPGVRGRGVTTGGRLEIAGVVVGNWGPNCRLRPDVILPPQVTSVGGIPGYSGGGLTGRGRGATFSTRGGTLRGGKGRGLRVQQVAPGGKKKNVGLPGKRDNKKQGKGRGGMTVVSPFSGEVVPAAVLLESNDRPREETKRILTNSDKKSINSRNNKQTPQQVKTGNGNIMVNGAKAEMLENTNEQFADTNSLPSDIMIMNGEGEGPAVGVKAIFTAATCKDN